MSVSAKNKILSVLLAGLLFGLSAFALLRPKDAYSESERRLLTQMPKISAAGLLSGSFMTEFEEYTLDQFPLREWFRTLKALANKYLYQKSENNGIYIRDGYYAAVQYPLDTGSLEYAAKVFNSVYDRYFADGSCNVYFSLIPDKGYFLQEEAGQLQVDYDVLASTMREKLNRFSYIDIFPTLELADYYKTDTHWRQENLTDTADAILDGMHAEHGLQYVQKALDVPFYGVYYGQAALPAEAESIFYLDNELFGTLHVYDHENRREIGVYDFEKGAGRDPYEFFLSGPLSLVTIENPNAATARELFVFRDSFASSLAPLLVESYAKITLLDIRYMPSIVVGNFVQFSEGADVLFLYSTMILNASNVLK